MARLLLRLNNAPEDEAEDVRRLLAEHHIDFYETHAGRWGISVAGIWLRDDTDLGRARELVDAYQDERSTRMRRQFEEDRREGRHETMIHRLRRHPLQFLFYIIAILAVLYLSIVPLVSWS